VSRGGARPGAGRPRGPTATTQDLVRRLKAALQQQKSIAEALSVISDDDGAPVEVRIAALTRLAGFMFGDLARNLRKIGKSVRPELRAEDLI
jgi:hypothetical protein